MSFFMLSFSFISFKFISVVVVKVLLSSLYSSISSFNSVNNIVFKLCRFTLLSLWNIVVVVVTRLLFLY